MEYRGAGSEETLNKNGGSQPLKTINRLIVFFS
jgi:hypothetical protein